MRSIGGHQEIHQEDRQEDRGGRGPAPDEPVPEAVQARVRQTLDADALVVDVSLPEVDSADDVQVTIGGGWLHVYARRFVGPPAAGGTRPPCRLDAGAFAAAVPLPAGVVESDAEAVYAEGRLEVRIPFDPTMATTARIAVKPA